MKISEAQRIFALNIARLIIWAYENGYELTFGEADRSNDQQLLHFEGYTLMKIGDKIHLVKAKQRSKTMKSGHLDRLAVDLNLFVNGQYKTEKEAYKPLAEYWKSLHPKNTAGYDWGWDANHFEMKR